jgi:signal transduction histidine kinase/ActR/RegA family two-component response regulator
VAEQEELDFRELFEALPGLFWAFDPEFRILAGTDAVVESGQRPREEVLGRKLLDAFPENPEEKGATGESSLFASLDRVRKTLKPDSMPLLKYDVIRSEEEGGGYETRYWSLLHTPYLDEGGQLRYIFQRAEDVTEYVRLKEHGSEQEELAGELRERTQQMESEILRRSEELTKKNDQLRRANEAKNEFLSRMSHELRTPLAAVMGFSELLSLSDLDEEKRDWASSILKAGRHLLALVDEVLDISRLESGDFSISLESIPVQPLLQEALELVRPLAEGREVTIHPPEVVAGSGYAVADNQRLKQVLINLLSNAIKYNRTGGEVRVRVRSNDGERLAIDVIDTGKGIDEASLTKLFTPFERLDAAGSDVEGTGLGLALSRTLVQGMGGAIEVDSVLGEGSTFTIELNRGEPAAVKTMVAEERELLAARTYSTERSLLYVEDTVANVRLIEEILTSRPSIHLLPAMMGGLGLELALEHQPDLILLDLHLPDIGGEKVLAHLRDDERTRDIPVVMLSADATKRTPGPLLEAGASAYLTKPIGVRQLLEVVDQYLGD